MRPRCTLRWRTFLGINMVALAPSPSRARPRWSLAARPTWSVFLAAVELGRLVVLASPALDLLFLGEETLELGVGLLHQRRRLGEVLIADRGLVHRGRLVGRTAATATGADDAATRGAGGV